MEFISTFPCKVVVCGDSISAGIVYDEDEKKYVKSKEGFVNILQSSVNCVVKNISRFGNTIVTAMPRLKRDIEKEAPNVVLIELGGNDCDYKWEQIAANPLGSHLPATDADVFEKDLVGLVGSLRTSGVAPVLMTLPPIDADRYFKWVSKSSVETATNILAWLGSVTRIYWWQEKYNAAVVKTSERTHTERIDLRSAFLSTPDYRNLLCADGIHPNRDGHALISQTISEFLAEKCPILLRPALV